MRDVTLGLEVLACGYTGCYIGCVGSSRGLRSAYYLVPHNRLYDRAIRVGHVIVLIQVRTFFDRLRSEAIHIELDINTPRYIWYLYAQVYCKMMTIARNFAHFTVDFSLL